MLPEFALGYTVREYFVLAAGLYGSTGLGDASLNIGGRGVDTGSVAAITWAGCVDVYPYPHKGLHFAALVGLAQIVINHKYPSFPETRTGFGWGGGLEGGYEWWVSRSWSLGALGRVSYAQARVSLDRSVVTADHVDISLVTFGAAFAATYH